jgi:hypothetical protein
MLEGALWMERAAALAAAAARRREERRAMQSTRRVQTADASVAPRPESMQGRLASDPLYGAAVRHGRALRDEQEHERNARRAAIEPHGTPVADLLRRAASSHSPASDEEGDLMAGAEREDEDDERAGRGEGASMMRVQLRMRIDEEGNTVMEDDELEEEVDEEDDEDVARARAEGLLAPMGQGPEAPRPEELEDDNDGTDASARGSDDSEDYRPASPGVVAAAVAARVAGEAALLDARRRALAQSGRHDVLAAEAVRCGRAAQRALGWWTDEPTVSAPRQETRGATNEVASSIVRREDKYFFVCRERDTEMSTARPRSGKQRMARERTQCWCRRTCTSGRNQAR